MISATFNIYRVYSDITNRNEPNYESKFAYLKNNKARMIIPILALMYLLANLSIMYAYNLSYRVKFNNGIVSCILPS